MSYTPTGYGAKTLVLGIDVLCGIAAWNTLPGIGGTAELARKRVVQGVGGFAHGGTFRAADGTQQTLACPLAQFAIGNPESDPNGFKSWARDGSMTVDLAIAPLANATDDDAYLRMVDLVELIHQGYEDAANLGTLLLNSIKVTGSPMLADPNAAPPWLRGSYLAQLTLGWSIGER